jgi:hypothetical protein
VGQQHEPAAIPLSVAPCSIVQEVVEELHIPMEHLDAANAQMLGLVRRLPDMRYQLVMALDCLLTKDEVRGISTTRS